MIALCGVHPSIHPSIHPSTQAHRHAPASCQSVLMAVPILTSMSVSGQVLTSSTASLSLTSPSRPRCLHCSSSTRMAPMVLE